MTRRVTVERGPDAQSFGPAALVQGMAAQELLNAALLGIKTNRSLNSIEPTERLLRAVAVLKSAIDHGRAGSTSPTAITDGRIGPTSRESGAAGEVVGLEEVARMFGISVRHARRLTPSLGGWRDKSPGRPYRFHRDRVQAYLDIQGAA